MITGLMEHCLTSSLASSQGVACRAVPFSSSVGRSGDAEQPSSYSRGHCSFSGRPHPWDAHVQVRGCVGARHSQPSQSRSGRKSSGFLGWHVVLVGSPLTRNGRANASIAPPNVRVGEQRFSDHHSHHSYHGGKWSNGHSSRGQRPDWQDCTDDELDSQHTTAQIPIVAGSRRSYRGSEEEGGWGEAEGEEHSAQHSSVFSHPPDHDGHVSSSDSEQGAQEEEAGMCSDSNALVGREPVYQVLEVLPNGQVNRVDVSRRQLLRSNSLRPRDIRRIDPSLWVTNSMPALIIRDGAILMNLGTLRAMATPEHCLIFDYTSPGGQAFIEVLLAKLAADHSSGPMMPFELEVLEASLVSRTQRLEAALMKVEPRVKALLEVLPNKLTADALEELRLSKQLLVELASKAGALRQMLLEILEHSPDIRRVAAMGRHGKGAGVVRPGTPERRTVDEEEQEVEMLLEYYLQKCDSCHGQAERLLDSAKEAEDSIAVNLSSRRLEVSKLELLLQVATFCVAVGALVAGIFGMNLKSSLEAHVLAFWITTVGIVWGGLFLFSLMLLYLRGRRVI